MDQGLALRLTGGNASFAQQLPGMLAQEIAKRQALIRKAFAHGDLAEVRDQAHQLAGAAACCAAPALKAASLALELASDGDQADVLKSALSEFHDQCARYLRALDGHEHAR